MALEAANYLLEAAKSNNLVSIFLSQNSVETRRCILCIAIKVKENIRLH